MDYYQRTGNGRLTCQHFGISPDTFYRWKRRYQKDCLKSLEDGRKSRRPNALRHPETAVEVVEKIRSLRETYPRWGKEKLFVLLKKEKSLGSQKAKGLPDYQTR
jgi:transposase